ncbi:MAG: Spy/CpxP family protein refolding chaperone [Leptospiraceae bacterium]|nr:Spy/CpxP family protein refolding chaperone [Leptospiraceae bacterium]MCP5497880.1 Spy/CpxP family protein refolding chaperone [Leptospiraceae bacterium]
MKNIQKNIFIFVLVVLTVAFTVTCEDKFHKMSPEKKAEKIVEKLSSNLNLDDEQKQKLNQIKDEVVAKMKANMKNRGSFSKEFAEDIKSDTLNKEKLLQFLKDRADKRNSMHEFMVDKFIEFHAILNPEQREKLAEKIEKFGNRFKKHQH